MILIHRDEYRVAMGKYWKQGMAELALKSNNPNYEYYSFDFNIDQIHNIPKEIDRMKLNLNIKNIIVYYGEYHPEKVERKYIEETLEDITTSVRDRITQVEIFYNPNFKSKKEVFKHIKKFLKMKAFS
jgi:hypothetical protein